MRKAAWNGSSDLRLSNQENSTLKPRWIASLFALAALALFGMSVWVPPFGGGPSQLIQPVASALAAAPVAAPTTPQRAGHTWVYGVLRNADGQPLPFANIRPVLSEPLSKDKVVTALTYSDSKGHYAIELPNDTYDFWFDGDFDRLSSGSTVLGSHEVNSPGPLRLDLQLPGGSSVIGEIQVSGFSDVLVSCELIDAQGQRVANGEAESGSTLLLQISSFVQQKAMGARISVGGPGRGLCFEGLTAGEYSLRAHLNSQQDLTYEHPVRLEAGEALDLGRLKLEIGDFAEHLRGAKFSPVD